jgi:hypothetical protein
LSITEKISLGDTFGCPFSSAVASQQSTLRRADSLTAEVNKAVIMLLLACELTG